MIGRGAIGGAAGLACWAGNCWLVAQADVPAPPTTIIAAFITIALSLGGLVVWIVKRLFDDLAADRKLREADRDHDATQREAARKHDTEEREKDRKHAALTIDALRMELSRFHEGREKDREQLAVTLTELRRRRHERDAREESVDR